MEEASNIYVPFVDGESKNFIISRWYFRTGGWIKPTWKVVELALGDTVYTINAETLGALQVLVDGGRCVSSGELIGKITPLIS